MYKKRVFSPILIILVSIFLLACCSFYIPLKLDTPILFHNSTEETISWNNVKNTEKYDVYINNSLFKTLKAQQGTNKFDYGVELTTNGLYVIKVKAIGDGKKYTTSDFSEKITIKIGEEESASDAVISGYNLVNQSSEAPQSLELNGTVLSWPFAENIKCYIVGIFNNDTGTNYYEIDSNYIDLSLYESGNEVLYVRVGSVYNDDNNVYFSNNLFYSPLNKNTFTSNYFIFDGGVYDFYIESYSELQALYYYAFVNRLEEYNFLVSSSFQNLFDTNYSANTLIRSCFKETYGYNNVPYLTQLAQSSPLLEGLSEAGYKVKCEFFEGADEPKLENNTSISTPLRDQNLEFTPYYEIADYEARSEEYDEFESDNNFIYTTVTTSEQLFWALQSGYTPIFSSTNCRAYLIYEKAKQVLNTIISDEMTDYEKVLSIFDWICNDTTYDYYAYAYSAGKNPMEFACYYLEGVFLDSQHLAVCDGYSKAFVLLCNMEGIKAVRITGDAVTESGSGGHAWNKVKLGSKWFMVDITWTEVIKSKNIGNEEIVSHQYFLIDHTDFEDSHIEAEVRNDVYDTYTDGGYYSYYKNTYFTHNQNKYDLFIEDSEELNTFLEFCAINKIKGIDVMFSKSFVTINNSYSNLSNYLLEEKPIYQTLSYMYVSTFAYDYEIVLSTLRQTKTGYIVMFEPSIMIKNQSTLNDWLAMVVDNNISSYDNVSISIDSEFLESLPEYDESESVIVNLTNAFNSNANLSDNNLEIELTLVEEDLTSTYNSVDGEITINYNIYNVNIKSVFEE